MPDLHIKCVGRSQGDGVGKDLNQFQLLHELVVGVDNNHGRIHYPDPKFPGKTCVPKARRADAELKLGALHKLCDLVESSGERNEVRKIDYPVLI